MLKLAIIGCGRIAETGHAPALSGLGEMVRVIALCDPSAGRIEAVARAMNLQGFRSYSDYMEMLEKESELDVVDLALPHFLHEEITLACARAGLHIISEKPLSTTLASVDRILDAVGKSGVKLAVLHNDRHDAKVKKALGIISGGAIGNVFLVRCEGLQGEHYRGAQSYDPDWRTRNAQAGGGCLIDNAYHDIYLAREFMGSPVASVFARIGTFLQPIDVDDTALLLLAHESGGTSSIQSAWSIKGGSRRIFEVHGDRGSIYSGREGRPLSVFTNETGEWTYPDAPREGSFYSIFRDTLKAMEEGTQVPADGLEARRNLEVVEAAYRSARTGEVVKIGSP